MTGCANRDEWLLDLLDGELSPRLAAEVEEHLATCAECRRAVEDYRAIIDSYRSGPVEEPFEGEAARILRSAVVATERRRRTGRVALAAAATLLLAGGAIGGYLLRGMRSGEAPPVEMAPSRGEQEAEREAAGMRRLLAEMREELERARAGQGEAAKATKCATARAGDAGVEAAKAAQAAKAAPVDADEITGGAIEVDGPRGGSGGLAAPRWQAKKKMADDPLSGDLDL